MTPRTRRPTTRSLASAPNRAAARRPSGRAVACACLVLAALGAAGTAGAQELYTYPVSAFGGLGGSLDADPGDSLNNGGFQLGATYVTEAHTRIAVRAGRLGLADGGRFGDLTDAELDYVTLSGEYRFKERYYDSWTYIGLGGYRVDGTRLVGTGEGEESAVGLAIGLAGEFTLTRSLDVVVEVSGHYADLTHANVFAMGHAGLAFHF